ERAARPGASALRGAPPSRSSALVTSHLTCSTLLAGISARLQERGKSGGPGSAVADDARDTQRGCVILAQ
ncbi:MAG: hypothetical protein ACRDQY_15155, partial [Pseudonocardiaceae bacterium]